MNSHGPAQKSARRVQVGVLLASEKFKAVYDQAYWDLYEQIYGSGFAEKTLENLRSQVPATDGTPQSDIDSAADKLQEFITQRKDYLATQKA